jgi:amidase
MEITIPKLEELYRTHQYSVTNVVRWYIDRIKRYNGMPTWTRDASV